MSRAKKGDVWTLAEQYNGKLKTVSFELLSRGRSLADKLGVKLCSVLVGPPLPEDALRALIQRGADEVIAVEDEALTFFCSQTYSGLLEALIMAYKPEIFLAAATTFGRTLMPYTAVRVHAGLTADCTGLDIEEGTGNLLQTRPAIGGNIMATIKTPDHKPQMATVRPRSSRPLEADPTRQGTVIRFSPFGGRSGTLPEGRDAVLPGGLSFPPLKENRTRVKGCRREEAGFVNLEEAEIIISGGRGIKRADNFGLLREIAERLGGEVGASRDAVDRGWMSYPHQVGLSGKTVSPKVYMGVGISGAIQHLAGIKTSEAIISINIDPDANLHKVADLAIVGDYSAVLEALRKRLGA